jgi:four helix bundle protein
MSMTTDTKTREKHGAAFKAKSKQIRDHRDLRVWRKGRRLAELCTDAVATFPEGQEQLAGVICRLANEVPSEIEAGQSQGRPSAYLKHLGHARTAVRHLERRLIEAHSEHLLTASVCDPFLVQAAEIERMLKKLVLSLELAYARGGGVRTRS